MKKKNILGVIAVLGIAGIAYAFTPVYAHKSYQSTEQIWTNVYESLTKNKKSVAGTTYIAPLRGNGYIDKKHKNGARDTIIFIPDSTNFKQSIDIIFYFHGLGGFKERDFKTRVLEHTTFIEPIKNYVIVIPEMPWSKNTSTPHKRQGRVFTKKGEFGIFVEGIRNRLREHFHPDCTDRCPVSAAHILGDVILLGHSAGGSTLMSISRSGGLNWLYDKGGASSVKVIFSDASYGYWLDITWKHFKPYIHGTEFLILTRKWDKPYRHTMKFLNKFRKKPRNFCHIVFSRRTTHAGIGDQSFKWVYENGDNSGCGKGEKK